MTSVPLTVLWRGWEIKRGQTWTVRFMSDGWNTPEEFVLLLEDRTPVPGKELYLLFLDKS